MGKKRKRRSYWTVKIWVGGRNRKLITKTASNRFKLMPSNQDKRARRHLRIVRSRLIALGRGSKRTNKAQKTALLLTPIHLGGSSSSRRIKTLWGWFWNRNRQSRLMEGSRRGASLVQQSVSGEASMIRILLSIVSRMKRENRLCSVKMILFKAKHPRKLIINKNFSRKAIKIRCVSIL